MYNNTLHRKPLQFNTDMARKTKQEAERTYHALLDAATLLFISQGVANTTLGEIAAGAGMTRGAVYWHFDNKDAVIMALWKRNAETLHSSFSAELNSLDREAPAAHFRDVVKHLVHIVAEQPEIGQVLRIIMHSVEMTDEETELQQFLKSKHRELNETMTHAFSILKKQRALLSRLSPELLAQGLNSYLFGLIHNYLEPGQKKIDLQKHGDELLDLFLESILVA